VQGDLNEAEIQEKGNKILARILERRWKNLSETRVVLASGKVKQLAGNCSIRLSEWEELTSFDEGKFND
jgi:hypothetical protein